MPTPPVARRCIVRRHPLLAGIALLAVLAVALAGLFLATFDLNAYRNTLAERLSSALDQPVSIGAADMSWRRGPVFNISAIRIGAAETAPIGEISHLFLQPRLLPLLTGKIAFDKMIVDHPRYRLQLSPPAPGNGKGEATGLLTALLQTVQVRQLTVIDGQLTLDDRRTDRPLKPLIIEAIALQVRDLAGARPCRLRLSARLPQADATATLSSEGSIALDAGLGHWRQARGRLQIRLQDIDPEALFERIALPPGSPIPTGRATLELSTEGSLAKGLHFTAGLSGQALNLTWPGRYHQPPAFSTCAVSGTWISSENLERLTDLQVRFDDLHLRGRLSLHRDPRQPWLEGNLSSSALALADIRRLLPDTGRLPQPAWLHAALGQGRVQLHHLRFAGPVKMFLQTDAGLPISEASLTLSEGRLHLPPAPPLEQVACTLTLQDDRLHLSQGEAMWLAGPVEFSGTADQPWGDGRHIAIRAAWTPPAAELLRLTAAGRAEDARAVGRFPVMLSLSGAPGQLRGTLQADLADGAFELPGIFAKTAGSAGEIRITARQQPAGWIVEQGMVNLPPFDLRLAGQIGGAPDAPLDLGLQLAPTDLAKAAHMVPALARNHMIGTVALQGRLSGPLRNPDFAGRARLVDVGLSLEALEADLRDIRGDIAIQGRACRFAGLRARLGESVAKVDGEISGGTDPTLTFHATAPTLRAGDLIFPGSDLVFRNLDGTLSINRRGIRYQQIRFDLQNSRHFLLQGEQLHTVPTTVDLDIHAEQASIDEVLSLWNTDREAAVETEPSRHDSRLTIRAAVDRGSYGPLSFTDARGTIFSQHNRITIAPLAFRAGVGSCLGDIVIDHRDRQPSILTITAKLEGVDAEHLHSDLLQGRGLLTGKLDADVQLQGPAGAALLKEGSGRAEIHVKDGVLRKFSFLSKVFSLLNVGQIFTLHLPDMASKGMPFTALDATFDLRNGKLATEDLAVASNAMNLSLVGDYDLRQDRCELLLGVKPFGTVDKIVSKIPLAGWILTGDNKALITAHFRITGPIDDPEVDAIPITSVSDKVLGIFKRTLGLPGKMVDDMGKLFKKEEQAEPPAEAEHKATDHASQLPAAAPQPQ